MSARSTFAATVDACFAVYQQLIGFSPGAVAIVKFHREIARYKTAAGSVQFLLDTPMPVALIKRMVKFRVTENVAKAKSRKPSLPVFPELRTGDCLPRSKLLVALAR